jgi:phage tail sheath protein FI/uncharacterized protein YjdB
VDFVHGRGISWQTGKEDEFMSTYTYPGVYIEELSSGVHTITGVATSIAAFVGWAPQGPVSDATLVESWAEYEALFGGLDSRSDLGYAVNQFFNNGGQQAYIVRLVWDGSVPASPGTHPAVAKTAVAAGLGYGTTQITASSGSITSPPATLSVGTPVLQSIAITPGSLPPIPINATGLTFTATGTNSDGTTTNLSASATWTSSDNTVITPGVGGAFTPSGPGTAVITAADAAGVISGSSTVTVSAASISATTGIQVSPNTPNIDSGQTQQFAATATYSDSSTHDITALATWAVAGDFDPKTPGLFNQTTAGAHSVTAAWLGSTSPAATATVAAAGPVSLMVTRVAARITKGTTQVFNAEAVNSDGTTTDVSTTATWTSSNPAVASITAPNTVNAVDVGSATITATSGSFSASTTVTVTAANLASIAVSPAAPSIAKGQSLQLKATGVYDDGTTADLTGCADWTSATPGQVSVTQLSVSVKDGVATLSNGSITGVAVTGAAVNVTAAFGGKTSNPAAVSVTAAVLASIAVTPKSKTILPGQTQQFTATGTFSDATTQSPLAGATWASSNQSVATINSSGLASAVGSGGSLTLFANNPGVWGNNLRVTVTVPNPNPNNRFNLLVQEVDPTTGAISTLESFSNLSVSITDPQYVGTVIDTDSNYITLLPPGATPPPPAPSGPPSAAGPIALSGGADGAVLEPAGDGNFELAMTFNAQKGVFLLSRVDIFNLLCVPGETVPATIQGLQKFCHDERAFYIVDAPQTATHATLLKSGPAGSTGGSITGTNSENSAYYFPWVQAPDPLFGNRPTYFPPCGFVAGIYAATDAGRGVWKAPAGISTALTGVSGLQYVLTDVENGDLNTQAINCLRQFKVYGDVVWGARTLQGSDQAGSEWKYIPIRRLALYIESSLYDGTQWVVFEPNDEKLWGQIRMNVGAFMQQLFLKGAFQGTSPQKAYFVKCDSENNPQSSIDLGIVNITVGFAPLFPAEFVVIQIVQIAGQSL